MLKGIAIGVGEINEDDVGVILAQIPVERGSRGQNDNIRPAPLQQSINDVLGFGAIWFDDENFQIF
ncbi:hypothetical protein OAD38_08040 [Ascidiaceihabitans sp.]|nr:hypothetical protein [Ascidiaceihabitans sp.]